MPTSFQAAALRAKVQAEHNGLTAKLEPCPGQARLLRRRGRGESSDGRRGHIKVTLAHGQEQLILSVEDDGCGMLAFTGESPGSLGTKINRSLTQQLGGELSISSGEGGTKAQATFFARQ